LDRACQAGSGGRLQQSKERNRAPHTVQAEAVAQALAGSLAVAIYTSPLERARTSAEVITKPHRLEPVIEPDFREMAFGAWEALHRDEVAARHLDAWATVHCMNTLAHLDGLREDGA